MRTATLVVLLGALAASAASRGNSITEAQVRAHLDKKQPCHAWALGTYAKQGVYHLKIFCLFDGRQEPLAVKEKAGCSATFYSATLGMRAGREGMTEARTKAQCSPETISELMRNPVSKSLFPRSKDDFSLTRVAFGGEGAAALQAAACAEGFLAEGDRKTAGCN
jgi:hypothetical protein